VNRKELFLEKMVGFVGRTVVVGRLSWVLRSLGTSKWEALQLSRQGFVSVVWRLGFAR
jgi:hypothetical protein